MPAVVHPAAVGGLPELALQPVDGEVERLVEVGRAGLGADHRPAHPAGDLDPLADLGLTWILLVKQLDVGADYLGVIALYPSQFVGNVLPVVIGNFDVTASHDNIHAASQTRAAPALLALR